MVSWITENDLFNPQHIYAPRAAQLSSGILFNLTGEKFQGIHTTTEVISNPTMPTGTYGPQVIGGEMYNLPVRTVSGVKYTEDSCFRREMRLRHGPVHQVFSLKADGVEIPRDSYSLRNNSYLVKKGRNGYWDFCSTHEFEVTYEYGANPPIAGIEAAIDLGNEMILAFDGSDLCKLPQRITSMTRQGISINVADPEEYFADGRVGIYSVDMFIKAYNPSKAKKKSKVFVPGAPRQERVN